MYSSIVKSSVIEQISAWHSAFQLDEGPDGLTMATPSPDDHPLPAALGHLDINPRLGDWFAALRLLRLPLAYLVPDNRLLPPESVRFFHVDRTWTDRVIDGAMSLGRIGTVDAIYQYSTLKFVRDAVDDGLKVIAADDDWDQHDGAITGMLIRSQLVSRWPELLVSAYADDGHVGIPILRRELISRSILIALFAGIPQRVDVREPDVGIRFGFDGSGTDLTVDLRQVRGAAHKVEDGNEDVPVDVVWRDKARRVVDVGALLGAITNKSGFGDYETDTDGTARVIAINLEQPAWDQVFRTSAEAPESAGWEDLEPLRVDGLLPLVPLRGGRSFSLESHALRLAQQSVRSSAHQRGGADDG